MLRVIVKVTTPQERVLALYGSIAGPEVGLLAEEGQRHLTQVARLVLDLDEVQFIDRVGLALLKRWDTSRLQLRGGSSFLRALLAAEGLNSN